MIKIDINNIERWYAKNSVKSLCGRYVTLKHIEPILKKLNAVEIGKSVKQKPIYKYQIGTGKTKVLIWTQMHGNESTGTKAIFDLFKFFLKPDVFENLAADILNNCQIIFIPMLNPDGSEVYTRVNANNIDLNRDAVALSQTESRLLRKILEEFNPEYCFNLHDQRTIFTVGNTKETATLSFLAPSISEKREITEGRKETMRVIVAMNNFVQQIIPAKVGRYTDEFYPTATGDNFQKLGHNTILIEAGHYKEDYEREKVRKFNFYALLQGLNYISSKPVIDYDAYFNIPNNSKFYLDKIFRNVYLKDMGKIVDIGIIYNEILKEHTIEFEPVIKYTQDLSKFNSDYIENKKGLSFDNIELLKAYLKKIC